MCFIGHSQREHLVDQLEPIFETHESIKLLNNELLYIVLVVTVINPAYSLREFKQDACSGTFLREHLVLTSASCLIHATQENPEPRDTAVFTRAQVKPLKAIRIYIHPAYTRGEDHYNVAIVEVEGKNRIKHFPKIPKKLETFQSIISTCKLGGYGKLVTFHLSNFHIVQMSKSLVTEFTCKNKSNDKICLHFENLLPCNGDVGSPMICDGEIFAFFSPNSAIYPEICMERYGAKFMLVYSIKDWINRIISAPQISVEWLNNPLYILLLCGGVLAIIGTIYYLLMAGLQKTFEPLDPKAYEEDEGEDEPGEWAKDT